MVERCAENAGVGSPILPLGTTIREDFLDRDYSIVSLIKCPACESEKLTPAHMPYQGAISQFLSKSMVV